MRDNAVHRSSRHAENLRNRARRGPGHAHRGCRSKAVPADRRQADDVPFDRGAGRGRRASPASASCSRRSTAIGAQHDWSALPDKIEPMFAGRRHSRRQRAQRLEHLGDRAAPRTTGSWCTTPRGPASRRSWWSSSSTRSGDDPVGGLLAMPLADTLKSADENQRVSATIPRTHLWRAQTPQMFRYGAAASAALRRAPTPPTSRRRWKAWATVRRAWCRARTATSRSPSPRTWCSPR